jgi:hypothetical protein
MRFRLSCFILVLASTEACFSGGDFSTVGSDAAQSDSAVSDAGIKDSGAVQLDSSIVDVDSGVTELSDSGVPPDAVVALVICPTNPNRDQALYLVENGPCSSPGLNANGGLTGRWHKTRNAMSITSPGLALSSTNTEKHDQIWAEVFTNTDLNNPYAVTSTITVINRPPEPPSAVFEKQVAASTFQSFRPGEYLHHDILRCKLSNSVKDPEGDGVGYQIILHHSTQSATVSNAMPGDSAQLDISTLTVETGDILTCSVYATDDDSTSPATSTTTETIEFCEAQHLTFTPMTGVTVDLGLEIPDHAVLDLGAEGTMEAWLLWNGSGEGNVYSRRHSDNAVYAHHWPGLMVESTGAVTARMSYTTQSNGGQRQGTSTQTLLRGVWTHVAMVWTSASILLYIDGDEQMLNLTPAGASPTNGNESAYLGQHPTAKRTWNLYDTYAFPGAIAKFRVSSIARYTRNFIPDRSYGFGDPAKTQFYLALDEEMGLDTTLRRRDSPSNPTGIDTEMLTLDTINYWQGQRCLNR